MKTLSFFIFTVFILISCSTPSKNNTDISSEIDTSKAEHKQYFENKIKFKSEKIRNLIGTKWVNQISTDCYDSMVFLSNKKLTYYYCEVELYCKGNYKVKNDTLLIDLFDTESEQHDTIMIHQITTKYKMILHDSKLFYTLISVLKYDTYEGSEQETYDKAGHFIKIK